MVNICDGRLSQASGFFRIRPSSCVVPLAVYNLIVHRVEIVLISPDISSVCFPMSSAYTRNMRDIILSLGFLDTVVPSDLLHVSGVLDHFSSVHHESRSFRFFLSRRLRKSGFRKRLFPFGQLRKTVLHGSCIKDSIPQLPDSSSRRDP